MTKQVDATSATRASNTVRRISFRSRFGSRGDSVVEISLFFA
jgi:hypothetical protein